MPEKGSNMPLLFLGHGSPMNAIEETEFSRGWQSVGNELGKPEAVLCISAHWETETTSVTAMARPRTIHDFYGFPNELFQVEYPAPGDPALAGRIKESVKKTEIGLDNKWGLDHGTWSVLKHIYPDADVPVVQLSLAFNKPPRWHYDLARDLSFLRRKGVLIIGSGNIVHNLGMIDWRNPNGGYDWANEFNMRIKSRILEGDHPSLIHYNELGKEARMAIPTPEHYLPLLYILGLKEKNEEVRLFNDSLTLGSLSMTSVLVRGTE
jgi:4,5-DOPA dioxygenase extradiol